MESLNSPVPNVYVGAMTTKMVTTWRVVDFVTCLPASTERVHFVREGELHPV